MNQNDICEDFRQSVALMAAGVIDPDEERRLVEHLKVCQSCERRYREYDSLSQGLRQAYRRDASVLDETMLQRVTAAIDTVRPERPLRRPVIRVATFAAVAASIAAVILSIVVGVRWVERSKGVAPVEAIRTTDAIRAGQGDPMLLASRDQPRSLPTLIELRAMLDRPEGEWESLLAQGSRSISTPSLSLETLLSE